MKATGTTPSSTVTKQLTVVASRRRKLEEKYAKRVVVDEALARQLVSYQGNKSEPFFRWYRYKEAFSAALVSQLLEDEDIPLKGHLLDPFAGMGTSLFMAGQRGLQADGIELLPVGSTVIRTGILMGLSLEPGDLDAVRRWLRIRPWASDGTALRINELAITRGAYPEETRAQIGRYLALLMGETSSARLILLTVLLSVLENVSFTRKDGQYLRWDHRAGRRHGLGGFEKPDIQSFDAAIMAKLTQVAEDIVGFEQRSMPGANRVSLFEGSCFDVLPRLRGDYYDVVLTSPPYCNRYDYTRTYALELALLGSGERELKSLRQQLLSSTVENRPKLLSNMNNDWSEPVNDALDQPLLKSILAYLEGMQSEGLLNNSGIPRMVRGYFSEMSCVIFECYRVLKPGGVMLMVNDNVKYSGVNIPVDLILSDIAEAQGFEVRRIRVLPKAKGNSSQQMSTFGRDPLRKCVYVWRKGNA